MKTSHLTKLLLGLLLTGNSLQAQTDTAQFKDCTITTVAGDKLEVDRFWRISDHAVEYEHEGNLHDLVTADIERVSCASGEYHIADGALRPFDLLADGQSLYQLGMDDARKYYSGGGALAAGFLTAPLLIVPPIVAAIPPPSPNSRNPNRLLYATDPDYRAGYRKKAHEKKAGFALLGMALGVITLIAVAQ